MPGELILGELGLGQLRLGELRLGENQASVEGEGESHQVCHSDHRVAAPVSN